MAKLWLRHKFLDRHKVTRTDVQSDSATATMTPSSTRGGGINTNDELTWIVFVQGCLSKECMLGLNNATMFNNKITTNQSLIHDWPTMYYWTSYCLSMN